MNLSSNSSGDELGATELDTARRQMMRLEVEEAALKQETDVSSKERLAAVQKQLADIKERVGNLNARWDAEKQSLAALGQKKGRTR